MSLLEKMLHGTPARGLSDAVIKRLHQEMLEIRKAVRRELKKMWTIDPEDAKIACKYGGPQK